MRQDRELADVIHEALTSCGLLAGVGPSTRIALKPNLTNPFYKPGVTTSPAVMRALGRVLRDYTPHVAFVESDGGYGAWRVEDAFAGHGLYELEKEIGVGVVSLHEGPREPIRFEVRGKRHEFPLPCRLLHETDLFITLPVPKIHCLAGLTLAHKNQWGCIPDAMRLRRHYMFDEAIVAINQALRPAVLGDGTYFLDVNGPMDGVPIAMGLVIAATDVGSFDRYVSELMGWSWRDVSHLRHAAKMGTMPTELRDIEMTAHPSTFRTRTFRLRRTLRNWIALAGFESRSLTWLGYESWFGREVLHRLLYLVAEPPPRPHAPTAGDHPRSERRGVP